MTRDRLEMLRLVASPDAKSVRATRSARKAVDYLMRGGYVKLNANRDFEPTKKGRDVLRRAGL